MFCLRCLPLAFVYRLRFRRLEPAGLCSAPCCRDQGPTWQANCRPQSCPSTPSAQPSSDGTTQKHHRLMLCSQTVLLSCSIMCQTRTTPVALFGAGTAVNIECWMRNLTRTWCCCEGRHLCMCTLRLHRFPHGGLSFELKTNVGSCGSSQIRQTSMCHKRHLKWVVYHHGVGVLFFEIPRQHVGDYAISRTTQHPHLGSEHARLQCRAAFQ